MSSRRERINPCQVRVFEKCYNCGGSGSVNEYPSTTHFSDHPTKWYERSWKVVQDNRPVNVTCHACGGTGESSYIEGEHDYRYTSEHSQKCAKCGHKTCDL